MCFNYFWFFTILLVKYHLNLLCDPDNVCLSFMILNVKWNLLIIGQRWRSTTGEMSNTWWCSSRFCTGTSTISYLHLCEKNKHTILEFKRMNKTWRYSHLNKATFIAPPFLLCHQIFTDMVCCIQEQFLKKLFSIIFDFSLFYWCSTTLIYYVILILFAYRLWT